MFLPVEKCISLTYISYLTATILNLCQAPDKRVLVKSVIV